MGRNDAGGDSLRALVGPGLHGEGLPLAVGRYVGSGRLVELVLSVVRGITAEGHHAGADGLVVRYADGNHDAEGNARRVVHVASSSVFKMQ